jgi:hypothetical protein
MKRLVVTHSEKGDQNALVRVGIDQVSGQADQRCGARGLMGW